MDQSLNDRPTFDHFVEDKVRVRSGVYVTQVFLIGLPTAMWIDADQLPYLLKFVAKPRRG